MFSVDGGIVWTMVLLTALVHSGMACVATPAVYATRLCGNGTVSTVPANESCVSLGVGLLCREQWSGQALLEHPADPDNGWLIGARGMSTANLYWSATGILGPAQRVIVEAIRRELVALLEPRCVPHATTIPTVSLSDDDNAFWTARVMMLTRTLRGYSEPRDPADRCAAVGPTLADDWDGTALAAYWSGHDPLPAESTSQCSAADPAWIERGIVVVVGVTTVAVVIVVAIAITVTRGMYQSDATAYAVVVQDEVDIPGV